MSISGTLTPYGARQPGRGAVWLLLAVALLGAAVGLFPPLAFLIVAVAALVIAALNLERLGVLLFWTLPYMVVNLPTGVFTLKLPEVVAYLFAAAFAARALLRRERIQLPPATLQVLLYLAVMGISAACSPPVPIPYQADVTAFDRNAPHLRSLSLVIWLSLSWLVVTGLYNVVGGRSALFDRCVRAHVLSGGLASLISIGIYVLALRGIELTNVGGQGVARPLAPLAGTTFRLAGV